MMRSMDDGKIYGKTGEKNLLNDHRVILLTVTEKDFPIAVQQTIAQDERLPFGNVAKLVGCINALEKRRDNVSQVLAEI